MIRKWIRISVTTFIIITFAGNCREKCNHIDKVFTDCNHKYWDLYEFKLGFVGSFRFDIDGSCYYLYYDRSLKRRRFLNTFDVKGVPNIWSVSDDTLKIQSTYIGYKFMLLTNKNILLSKYYSTKMLIVDTLKESEDQSDLYDFDSLKTAVESPYYFEKGLIHR